MNEADLPIVQRLVQESARKADFARLQARMLAKTPPPRMDALEGRMGALEQRRTMIEIGQHEVIRLEADVQGHAAARAAFGRRKRSR